MLAALRSLLRWYFAFTAMFVLPATIYALTLLRSTKGFDSSFYPYATFAGFLAVGALFAMACWTTRKSSTGRSAWAIVASLVNIATGIFIFRYTRHFNFASPEPLLIAIGIAGLFVFSRHQSASSQAVAAAKRTPVAGDRTSSWFDQVATVIFIVATWQAMGRWYPWARAHHLPAVSGIFSLLLIALVALVTAILHECGHTLAALAFQMKLLGFNVGPFQWLKREGKWTFQFKTSGILGGAVHVVPINPDQPRWHDVCMVAAGPLTNICTGPLFLWAAFHAQGTRYQPAWFFLALMASFAFLVAAFNLLPFRTASGSYSDGARILQLLTDSPVVELHRTMRRLQSTLVTALRFRDLDPDTFLRVASRYPRELTGLHCYLCAAMSFEDAGRVPEARAALASAEAIYNNFPINLPVPLHTVFIIDHACLNRDPAAARLWWDRMKAKKPEPPTIDYWLARTALLWIEGNLSEAEQAWHQADARAQNLPHFGAYEFDRYRSTLLRHELDSAALNKSLDQSRTPERPSAEPLPASEPQSVSPVNPLQPSF